MKRDIDSKANGSDADGGFARLEAAMALLGRVLNHQVNIATLIEAALWLAVPYVTVGLMWATIHPQPVQQIQSQLEKGLPAGADVAAFGEAAVLWPALLLLPDGCANR